MHGYLVVLLAIILLVMFTLSSIPNHHLNALNQIKYKYHHYFENSNQNHAYTDFIPKINSISAMDYEMQNQTTSKTEDFLNYTLTSASLHSPRLYIEYSRSGGQITSPVGNTISYNSTSDENKILFTNANGDIMTKDISNLQDSNKFSYLKRLITDNPDLIEKNVVDYRYKIICNDCHENNLTIAVNTQPHFITWYNESPGNVPPIVEKIAQAIVQLCGCTKEFYR
jgi:hypothetical protein